MVFFCMCIGSIYLKKICDVHCNRICVYFELDVLRLLDNEGLSL